MNPYTATQLFLFICNDMQIPLTHPNAFEKQKTIRCIVPCTSTFCSSQSFQAIRVILARLQSLTIQTAVNVSKRDYGVAFFLLGAL